MTTKAEEIYEEEEEEALKGETRYEVWMTGSKGDPWEYVSGPWETLEEAREQAEMEAASGKYRGVELREEGLTREKGSIIGVYAIGEAAIQAHRASALVRFRLASAEAARLYEEALRWPDEQSDLGER